MTGDDDQKMIAMTPPELRTLMRETVHETLTTLGVDAKNPIEMQKDFQHLREWRESMKALRSRSIMIIAATVVSGLLVAVWIGVKDLVLNGS